MLLTEQKGGKLQLDYDLFFYADVSQTFKITIHPGNVVGERQHGRELLGPIPGPISHQLCHLI